jgi:hypothetical protein
MLITRKLVFFPSHPKIAQKEKQYIVAQNKTTGGKETTSRNQV